MTYSSAKEHRNAIKIELTRTHFSGYSSSCRADNLQGLTSSLSCPAQDLALPCSSHLPHGALRSHANPETASVCTVKAALVLLFLSELNLLLKTSSLDITLSSSAAHMSLQNYLWIFFLWGRKKNKRKAYIKNKQIKCWDSASGNSKLISNCRRDIAVGISIHLAQQKAQSGSVLCGDTLQAHANPNHEHHWRG